MNNTFNIQRFGLLLKRQWLEFGKIYMISLLVSLGVIIAFYAFGLWPILSGERAFYETDLHFREPLFFIFGFLFISIIASTYFAHLGQKPKAIIDLMIPASTFEKFLTGIFFTSILASVSFIFLFYITDLAFVSKLKSLSPSVTNLPATGNREITDNLAYFFVRMEEPLKFVTVYIIPFFITSVFLLGSIYFNKFHYIKTAISIMIFSGIWCLIIFKLGKVLFEGKIRVQDGNTDHFNESSGDLLMALLFVVLTLIFWSITYIRLKEKEV